MFHLKRIILVTGPPGIGKTSVLRRTIRELEKIGYEIGGVVCHEVREAGIRVGFEIMDLSNGLRGWLAHVNQLTGPKMGKYHVNLVDLDIIGATAILDAIRTADIIAIDEIGPMELSSNSFSDALLKALESSKPLIGTIHYELNNSLIRSIKKRTDMQIIKVTYDNRADLHNPIVETIKDYMD